MRALVTGATGFVGSHVVDVLLERGFDISYIARKSSNHRWMDGKKAVLVEGSLHDLESLHKAMDGVDIVIHVAGQIAGKDENDFYRGNVGVTKNLLDAVRAYRPQLSRFVHVSSLAVTGPAPSLDRPVNEETPLRPLTAYGRTKKLAEDEVRLAMKEFPATIVRPPAVFGPRDAAIVTFFQSVNRGLAPLIGLDDKYLNLIHIRDLARGIVDAATKSVAANQTYFISSDEVYTWSQVANIAGAVTGRRRVIKLRIPDTLVLGIAGMSGFFGKMFMSEPPVLNYEKGIDFIQKYWICSNTKAHKDLGYRQEVSIEEGVLETMTWYREEGWL